MQGVHGDVSWVRLPAHRVSAAATDLSTWVGYQRGRHGPRLRIPPTGAPFRRPVPRLSPRPPGPPDASRTSLPRLVSKPQAGEHVRRRARVTTTHHYTDASLPTGDHALTHPRTSRRAIDNCFTCMHVITVWESTGRFILATSSAFPHAAGLPCRPEARTPATGWRTGMANGLPEADIPGPGHRVIRPDASASGGEPGMGFLPRPADVAAQGALGHDATPPLSLSSRLAADLAQPAA